MSSGRSRAESRQQINGQGHHPCPARSILGMTVHATSYAHASDLTLDWAKIRSSRYVCVATVNNVMEAYDSFAFRRLMNEADLVTPDGMPLVWGLKLLGHRSATRVYGPDLTPIVLQKAMENQIPVGFYGSSPAVLERLQSIVTQRFPAIQIAYAFSPPFRPLSSEEDEEIVAAINRSGARILFIGLNTPKQDFWMAAHRGRVQAVMLGVGAAFDFLAGTKSQAPRWMMRNGLEWLYRLATEPRRLWKRYLKHNPRFVVLFALQLMGWTPGGKEEVV
jgi:N-acetylglucosaminyldiphosphoundecaprenol N-acetyl-beta-D-mannosaminyltransferase